MKPKIDVKGGEYLILHTRQHPRKLLLPIVSGLLLAPIVGFAVAYIVRVIPTELQLLRVPSELLVLLQILLLGLVLLIFVVPLVLRPLSRYFRNNTWLTNYRLVHQRFFLKARRGSGSDRGFGAVTVTIPSIQFVYLKHKRGTGADVHIEHSGGHLLRLSAVPEPEKFVHQLQAQVSKAQLRTNVELVNTKPGE